jgi:PAS domain S-box-containing protein
MVHANEVLEQRVRERTAELETLNRHLTAEIQQRRQIEEGLRASETRYRRLYNRTPMALHSTNAEARLIDVNDTWLAMFGYTLEAVIGRCPAEFMTAESAERYREEAWPDMLASGGALRVVDYQFVTRSGRVFDGRLSAVGEFDAEGRFVRTWSATADVTAEKRADRNLRQAQRMEAVGQLTAGIAHDFNNLLTAILGNLELMAKRPAQRNQAADPKRADRLIAGARSAAERGAKLTAQLMAFSRQQKIAAEPVDLNMVIRGMLPLLRSTLGGNIAVTIQTDPALAIAMADPTQVELAVLNLAINSRDAMPNGGAITISTANVSLGEPVWAEEPSAGDYAVVRVSDTGLGISDAVRERMFEPFFTTKDVGKGSGLGLPQVLGVVKQLGGGLSVRSRPGEGTRISLFLPRAERPAAEAAETGVPAPAYDASRPQRGRILLVDDDADVRLIASAMLSDAGYEVVEASSGASALDALERAEAATELVVADIAMPGINGVEFAAIVRRSWPSLPVLLMTGYAGSELMRKVADCEVLRKPFSAAEMEEKVERAMTRGRRGRI